MKIRAHTSSANNMQIPKTITYNYNSKEKGHALFKQSPSQYQNQAKCNQALFEAQTQLIYIMTKLMLTF